VLAGAAAAGAASLPLGLAPSADAEAASCPGSELGEAAPACAVLVLGTEEASTTEAPGLELPAPKLAPAALLLLPVPLLLPLPELLLLLLLLLVVQPSRGRVAGSCAGVDSGSSPLKRPSRVCSLGSNPRFPSAITIDRSTLKSL